MRMLLLMGPLIAACSGTSSGTSTKQGECDAIAQEIRDKAGTRAKGICTSTAKDDVTRFGNACATLKQCQGSYGDLG